MSVLKAQRIINHIRVCSYKKTLMILELMLYCASYLILKLIYSGVENVFERN
ncbi:50S ribosomal protein L22, chloroplastic [Apostasia shenzhenica]|uniref:50S ribosomal protein L22, chloroplastic n=1 Tax=Apostasia shenzhenica TaxID=1088818 RepID=A0A2I0B7E1_9ASPA|nr:50S ribosomal protein L22, chloroplastic [Apostasia shenzhenica]